MSGQTAIFAVKAPTSDASLHRFVAEEVRDMKRILSDGGKPWFPGLLSRSRKRFGFNIYNDPILPQYAEDYLRNQYTLLMVDAQTGKLTAICEPPTMH